MKTPASFAVALALLGAVAASAESPGDNHTVAARSPTMTAVQYVGSRAQPAPLRRVGLYCDGAGLSGGCPTPREECRNRCYAAHEVEVLECLSGIEGILPFQREACYGRSLVRLGRCNAQCVQDHPV